MNFYARFLELLAEAGVRHVFGIPGDALNPLTDAMRKQDAVRWIRTMHEEGAAFAASGAAKLTGRLQVCAGTVGPGALHLLNGLADAQKDRAPVIAIMGQVPQRDRGSDYHQEIDLRRAASAIAEHVVEVEAAEAAPHVFVEAIHHAISRNAVSVLIVPAEVGKSSVVDVPVRLLRPDELGVLHAPAAVIDEAVRLLDDAKAITIFAGEGSRSCADEVLRLAEHLRAPLIRSLKAHDLYPDDHALVCGELGVVGSRRAVEAMHHADVLLMIGTDFPYREWYREDAHVIQIDTRAQVIGRRSPRTLPVHAHAASAVEALVGRIKARHDGSGGSGERGGVLARVWSHFEDKVEHEPRADGALRPQAVVHALAEAAPNDAVFCCDTGTSTVWAARHLHMKRGQRLTFCANLGSMAYALPAAIGSAVVAPGRKAIALCGDGAFHMLMGEFLTAVDLELDLKVVVLDNSSLGLIGLEQESEGYPRAMIGQHNPDYVAFAAACGGTGFRVEELDALRETMTRFLSCNGPAILAARVASDELIVPPSISLSQAWSFGLARARELFGAPGTREGTHADPRT